MENRIAVRARRAFDGERVLRQGALVLVADGRIEAVRTFGPVPDGWELVEVPGATLMPGLIDAHAHLCGDSEFGALDRAATYSDAELDAVIERALRAQLAAGVTTVRDLGDRDFAAVSWRDTPGLPAVVAAGPPITSLRGHCWNLGGEVAGEAEIKAAVAERVERGVDVVKVMASGGLATEGTDFLACQFTDAQLALLVAQAHAAGLPVTAHAHGLPAVEQAIDAGVDGIEHCTCVTPQGVRITDALLDTLAEREIAVCPTLGLVGDAEPPARIRELLERTGSTPEERTRHAARMHEAGVRLVSGGDSGIATPKPHGMLGHSVADLARGGVSPAAALVTATSVAAQVCGLGERKGRLREGYDADLLLLEGDPLTNPEALTNPPARTVLAGTVLETAEHRL
ncbi:metal-dependent hydrolase family protein [Prauserella cavernicola]|uniref:Amidohydrolase family protein n=1 Tax=Prauserella cavernicola TaxID=2800127 RepID=A0A934V6Y1_9PSEU|nr:amidohydrolase family protein [Prauserella cavernicola]MBK1786685.1 amidohydrolase family protein [Prauserella cavernicola]